MGLYSGGFIIGRICTYGIGRGGAYYRNFTVFAFRKLMVAAGLSYHAPKTVILIYPPENNRRFFPLLRKFQLALTCMTSLTSQPNYPPPNRCHRYHVTETSPLLGLCTTSYTSVAGQQRSSPILSAPELQAMQLHREFENLWTMNNPAEFLYYR